MQTAALVLSVLAILVALAARARIGTLARRVEDAERAGRRQANEVAERAEREQGIARELLARLARGVPVEPDMILEGRLWSDVPPARGRELVEAGAVRVLDVRSPAETAAGVIPGALRIPIEELAERIGELQAEKGRPTLVYCAMGVRSALACELLCREGHEAVLNLAGGFTSWSGPTERPA